MSEKDATLAVPTKAKRKAVDWLAVERDYQTGLLTNRALGGKHGVSHTAIQERAREEGWSKDLTARIRQKAEDKVSKDEVSRQVSKDALLATEREVIEANAVMVAGVMREHRRNLVELREIAGLLMEQVKAINQDSDLFENVADLVETNDVQKIASIYRKVTSLPAQTDVVKKLAEILKIIIELERKIFKIEEQPSDPIASAARGGAEGAFRGMGEGTMSFIASLEARMAARVVIQG